MVAGTGAGAIVDTGGQTAGDGAGIVGANCAGGGSGFGLQTPP
jgi:hypothetical protein